MLYQLWPVLNAVALVYLQIVTGYISRLLRPKMPTRSMPVSVPIPNDRAHSPCLALLRLHNPDVLLRRPSS